MYDAKLALPMLIVKFLSLVSMKNCVQEFAKEFSRRGSVGRGFEVTAKASLIFWY